MSDVSLAAMWIGIVLVVALFFGYWIYRDKVQERYMADKGYCYQSVERNGGPPSWQYQRCK